jgi:hypothetical protein
VKTARADVEAAVEAVEDPGQDKGQEGHGDHVAVTALDEQELDALDPDKISSAARASGLAVEVEEVDLECFLFDHKDLAVVGEG